MVARKRRGVVLVGSSCFLVWLLCIPTTDESSLSPADAFYDLGCVSVSDRRRCPCFVAGFRLL